MRCRIAKIASTVITCKLGVPGSTSTLLLLHALIINEGIVCFVGLLIAFLLLLFVICFSSRFPWCLALLISFLFYVFCSRAPLPLLLLPFIILFSLSESVTQSYRIAASS